MKTSIKHSFLLFLALGTASFAQVEKVVSVARPPTATVFVPAARADFGVWIDPKRWKQIHTSDDVFKLEFRHISGQMTAFMFVRRDLVAESDLIDAVIKNEKSSDQNFKLITQERRIAVGNKELVYLVMEAGSSNHNRSCGYYYSGPEGTIQLVVVLPTSLFEEAEGEVQYFLDGIQICASGASAGSGEGATPPPASSGTVMTAPPADWIPGRGSYNDNVVTLRQIFTGDMAKNVAQLQAKSDEGNQFAEACLAYAYAYGRGVQKDENHALDLLNKASANLPVARAYLGLWYLNGFVTPKDEAKAERILRSATDSGSLLAKTSLGSMLLKTDPKAGTGYLLEAAKAGFPPAQCSFALCFRDGTGVDKDLTKFVDWLEKAAGQEYSPAEELLADCYLKGNGVEKNPEEAIKLFRALAKEGDPEGQNNLAYCLWNGVGVLRDREESLKWIRKAAEQGFGDAAKGLGHLYLTGDGVDKDVKTAAMWFEKGANAGNVPSQEMIGTLYSLGIGVEKNEATAAEWLKKAADQDDSHATAMLGAMYMNGGGVAKDYEHAVPLLTKAADAGDVFGESALAECYRSGNGVQKDLVKAYTLDRDAAEKGDMNAQYDTGKCLALGEGAQKNLEEASKWFHKAADQGEARSQFQLGVAYSRGDGVTPNHQEAARWFRLSAIQGNAFGENAFGYALATGDGVEKDPVEAYKWYTLAMSQNESADPKLRAEGNMKALLPQMTPEQIEEGKKRASEFKPEKTPDDAQLPSIGVG